MIRSLGIRIGGLVLALLMFGATARADQLTIGNFRLVIVDVTENLTRVITDQQQLGILDSSGDKNFSTLGTIQTNAQITGAFAVTLTATSTTGPDGGAILTLNVTNALFNSTATPSATHTLMIGLEDTGFSAPGGNPGAMVTFQQSSTGNLPGSASEIDFNSWLDVAGKMPDLGANAGPTNRTLTFPVNTADPGNSQTFTTPGSLTGATSSGSNPVDLSSVPQTGYSLYSEALVTFDGTGGSANFTLTASDSVPQNTVPEPLSLVLLGSALLGYGVFRRKHQI